jgi:hypothetical protein
VNFDPDAGSHWITGALGDGAKVRLTTSSKGTYEALLDPDILDAEVISEGDAEVQVKIQASLRKVGVPDSDIVGLGGDEFPEKYGFVRLYLTYFVGLDQVRVDVRWDLGNTEDPEWSCYFDKLEVLLAGGKRLYRSTIGKEETRLLPFGPGQAVTLIDKTEYPGTSSLFMRCNGSWRGEFWLFPEAWTAPRPEYAWAQDETAPMFPGQPLEKVSAFAQDAGQKADAEEFTRQYLDILISNASIFTTTNGGKYQEEISFDDTTQSATGKTFAYRRASNRPFGAESGGRQIGPSHLVWVRQIEGPALYEFCRKHVARYHDRAVGTLHNELGELMHPAKFVAAGETSWKFFLDQNNLNLSSNLVDALWGANNATQDPWGFFAGSEQNPDVIAPGLGLPDLNEQTDRNYAQIDLQHHCRISGTVSVPAVCYGDWASQDFLMELGNMAALEWSYGQAPDFGANTFEGEQQLLQAPGSGPTGTRRQGWAGDTVLRALVTAKPGSALRADLEAWAQDYVDSLANAQFSSGGVNYFPSATQKENEYAQERVPNTGPGGTPESPDIRVTQGYQNIIITWSYINLVNYLDDWIDRGADVTQAWRWMHEVAWGAAQSAPDYRCVVNDATTGEVFSSRARVEQVYSSTVTIDCTQPSGCGPNDGNLTSGYYVPMWLAAGKTLVDQTLIPQAELDTWETKAYPSGIENAGLDFGDVWMAPVGLSIA